MPHAAPRKYDPLRRHLAGLPPEVAEVTLTFAEIEAVLGAPLPASARLGSFWANAPSLWGGTSQARAWRAAGWRATRPVLWGLRSRVTVVRAA